MSESSTTHRIPHCLHTIQHNHVHVFTVVRATQRCVEEWVEYLDQICEQSPAHADLYCLIDCPYGITPIFNQILYNKRRWLSEHPYYPHIWLAVVYQEETMPSLIQQLSNYLRCPNTTLRLFPREQKESAFNWLMNCTS